MSERFRHIEYVVQDEYDHNKSWNPERKTLATPYGHEVIFGEIQAKVFSYFMERKNQTITIRELYEAIWQQQGKLGKVRSSIDDVARKLQGVAFAGKFKLVNIHGKGYKLVIKN